MNKIFLFAVFSILVGSLVLAAQGSPIKQGNTSVTFGDDGSMTVNSSGKLIKMGPNSMEIDKDENGKTVRIRMQAFENHSFMNISGNWTNNETPIFLELSNGKNAQMKIMPAAASVKAIERLGVKVCNESNGCVIELKEVGTGNETRAAYEIQVQKEARILGIFKTQMDVSAEVDAETEEVIKTVKPWWAFLASE